jgi:HK97 family phage prohead protease
METKLKGHERRFFTSEIRIDSEGDGNTLIGYAAVFNEWSEDLGFFREKIRPGAFKKTLTQKRAIKALVNHDPNLILGSSDNGTLRLEEDSHGLRYEVDLPDTTYARDLKESVRRGDISQNSFGFVPILDRWSSDGSERTLVEVKLIDISPVTFPAYPQTDLSLRSIGKAVGVDFLALGQALSRSIEGKTIWKGDAKTIKKTLERLRAILGVLNIGA